MATPKDFWYITTRGEEFAAVYGADHAKNPTPTPGEDPKYLFATMSEAINYASKNYVALGIIIDPDLDR